MLFSNVGLALEVMQDSIRSADGVLRHLYLKARATAEASVNHPAGLLLLGELSFLIFISALMGGIESCRVRGLFFMQIAAAIPGQFLITASLSSSLVSFCFVWVPFLLNGFQGDRSAQCAERRKLTDRMYSLISLIPAQILTPCFFAFVFAHHHPESPWYNFLAAFGGYLQIFFWMISPQLRAESTAEQMERYAVEAYQGVALTIVGWRLFTLFCLRDGFVVLLSLLKATAETAESQPAFVFFLVDLIGLTLALTYLALLEDGPVVALCTLVGALSFRGPAPTFAIYCVYRELKIQESLKDPTVTTKQRKRQRKNTTHAAKRK
ncbi:hypothetical protein KFL_000240380 [Klebsormidium nitens]|uniref:Transmembrane protein n=1 Tax=Klebsormidium nitens TaxID=105231 RepID=A0A1Y1HR87_KLENI|nr:hypothetical protein KFL_000240380 [Klebsormidium nitens]|eukprot:GAQ79106.1 hypothetical protein KFL_000240380 [Klebsormidium nitens]